MKINFKFLIIGIVILGVGFLIGTTIKKSSESEAMVMFGPEIVQESILGLNKILARFPELMLPHLEHQGIFNIHSGWFAEWLDPDFALEDSPIDILMGFPVALLPTLEREAEEICIWRNTVCYFPIKNMSTCIWPDEFTQNIFCLHPGMDENNPEHPGFAHPSFLMNSSNLEGPLEYPPDFEERFTGKVFTRTEEQLDEIWK